MGNWDKKIQLAIKAREHTSKMSEEYSDDIKSSITNSIIFTGDGDNIGTSRLYDGRYRYNIEHRYDNIEFVVSNKYSSDAIMDAIEDGVTVLNFASYKHPGGMFIDGSSAQEEALCHDSFLYNVLSSNELRSYYAYNNMHLNKGLYSDRAVFSPDILFFNSEGSKRCNVITCAAPNNSLSERYGAFSKDDNNAAMLQRIAFLRVVADRANDAKLHDRIILGAWGCGVFKQDYEFVLSNLLKEFSKSTYKIVEFALPDKKMFNYLNEIIRGGNK